MEPSQTSTYTDRIIVQAIETRPMSEISTVQIGTENPVWRPNSPNIDTQSYPSSSADYSLTVPFTNPTNILISTNI